MKWNNIFQVSILQCRSNPLLEDESDINTFSGKVSHQETSIKGISKRCTLEIKKNDHRMI